MLPSRAFLAALVIAAAPLTGLPTVARAQPILAVRVDVVPPPLPVYLQPVIPADGYLWAPGYWDWDPAFGYYWVPGTWVLPPRPNLLWTPGYWGWDDGAYVFHRGYWDTEVGFTAASITATAMAAPDSRVAIGRGPSSATTGASRTSPT